MKLVHFICLAHALHGVTEEVRSKFPQVDALVSRTKIFVKAPARKCILSLWLLVFHCPWNPSSQGGERGLLLQFTVAIFSGSEKHCRFNEDGGCEDN